MDGGSSQPHLARQEVLHCAESEVRQLPDPEIMPEERYIKIEENSIKKERRFAALFTSIELNHTRSDHACDLKVNGLVLQIRQNVGVVSPGL